MVGHLSLFISLVMLKADWTLEDNLILRGSNSPCSCMIEGISVASFHGRGNIEPQH